MTRLTKILVVGATGQVGGMVSDELLRMGKKVYALVRPQSKADHLAAKGVTLIFGDMMDLPSLIRAMTGMDALITTAAGYTRHSKGDTSDTDTIGNRNLAEAAKRTGIKRFILTSILTADQTPGVDHFWHKKLAEDYLQERQIPFVALRPGAFLDAWIIGTEKDKKPVRIVGTGSETLPISFILTSQVARYLAAAVDAPVTDGERIDIGWEKPATAKELKKAAEKVLCKPVSTLMIRPWVVSLVGGASGLFSRMMRDMTAMVKWFHTGKFINQPSRQREVFGPLPTAEESMRELLSSRGFQTF